ncbi:transglutaminase-like domain-containing protein [Tabrizicola sp.]|uniref:transglutaminase-like domain-containing protein n=1 Tax=Tabrizicola sp. TaxID=2005166 RepID=UPI003F2F373D
MKSDVISIELTDTAAMHGAVALIAPLGIETEFQSFLALEAPRGWDATIVAERRSGQRAVVLKPPSPTDRAKLVHSFSSSGPGLSSDAYRPEGTPVTTAAAELAQEAQQIARSVGGGLAGIAAIVADTSARFSYGEVPLAERWYFGQDAVPIVACTSGNCIDINTYLVAALRAAGYEAAYLTCYFFDNDPHGIASGMHCWVRTRHDGAIQDWDIAHFKKANRPDVSATMNPIPGRRFALAFGRDHVYGWRDIEIRLSTPSRPMWVREDGTAIWGEPPVVQLVE